jgi:hypothetical protein
METTHLQLPLLAAAQSQKHITHNDAVLRLDALVQLAVKDRVLTAPPGSPSDGDRHIPASGSTGAWQDWDLNIAWYSDGVWTKLVPRRGWIAHVEDEEILLVWDGADWAGVPLSNSQAALSADVSIVNANEFYDGPSLSVGPGTWLITSHLTVGRTSTTLIHYTAKLWDGGSNVWASSEQTHPSMNPHFINVALTALVTLAATSTIKASVAATTGGNLIKATVPDSGTGTGTTASQLCAVRVG